MFDVCCAILPHPAKRTFKPQANSQAAPAHSSFLLRVSSFCQKLRLLHSLVGSCVCVLLRQKKFCLILDFFLAPWTLALLTNGAEDYEQSLQAYTDLRLISNNCGAHWKSYVPSTGTSKIFCRSARITVKGRFYPKNYFKTRQRSCCKNELHRVAWLSRFFD